MSTRNRKNNSFSKASVTKSQRLQALISLVPLGSNRLVDVGCDHAKVPLDLLSQGIVKELLLIDINAGPLERAKTQAKTSYPQYSEKIRYLQNDGLKGVVCRSDDILLISGLGGETIAGILLNAFTDKENVRPSKVILQPQTKLYELRKVLQKLSFSIIEERLVLDDDRFYNIIICDSTPGEALDLNELELYIGPVFIRAVTEALYRKGLSEADDLLIEWAERQAERLKLEGRGDVGRARLAEEWAALMERVKYD